MLLMLLLLVSLHDTWPQGFGLDPGSSLVGTLSGFGLLIVAMEFVNVLTRRAMRRDPSSRAAVMRFYGRLKRWHLIATFAFFFFALYLLGWGETIRAAEEAWPVPAFRVVTLLPIVVVCAVGWLRQYDVDRLNAEMAHYPFLTSFPSRWAYFGLQARHNLLFLLPPIVLLIAHESIFLFLPSLDKQRDSMFVALIGIGMLAAALVAMPLFLRIFLGLVPLPDGPLRHRLDAKARALRFRFSDVLLWNTRQGVANAMVTGVLPWLRYVVVTDQLLAELNDDEIEAVFGHEVGHMKHHHMAFYMIFIATSLMLLGALWSVGAWWLHSIETPSWLRAWMDEDSLHTAAVWLSLGVVSLYILIVFGWLSRRCERQADIFGCKTASPTAFISALEKVADLNGIPRERPGFFSWWQHSTIADRIDFIRRMQADPALEPAFQRRLGWTKWSLALGLIGLVALIYAILPRDILHFSNFGARIVQREIHHERAITDTTANLAAAAGTGEHGRGCADRLVVVDIPS